MVARKIPISGTHGKAVDFPDDGCPDDVDVHLQILDHLSDNYQLLKVLFPENGQVRSDNAQQLGDHCGDTVEMARAQKI